MRCGKQKWAGAVIEKVDEVTSTANITAQCADGFRERSYLDIDAAMHFEMIYRATTISAEDTGGVSVVDHHDRAVLFGEIAQRRQGADIAVHGKDSVGDQQLFPWLVFNARQSFFGLRHVLVFENENLCARQTSAVD